MKKILSLTIFILACASSNANAWFFFFLPLPGGSSSSGGGTCVANTAKEGDTFRSANGNVATIKSLSGTSSRCKNPELPILGTVDYATSSSFTPKAGMNLPDGYSPQSLTELQKFNGALLMAKNNATDSGVFVTTTKRDVISDMQKYATNLRANQTKSLDETQQSDIEQLTINGMKAWRFETKGKLKNLFGSRYTYLMTVLEGDKEVVAVNAWTSTGNYETQKEELKQLASNVTGIKTTPSPVESSPPPGQAAVAPIDSPGAATPATSTQTTSSASPTAPAAALPASNGPPATSENTADRLRDLNKLYKEGVITKEEFETKKKEILKSM